jgi:hypothetical protein
MKAKWSLTFKEKDLETMKLRMTTISLNIMEYLTCLYSRKQSLIGLPKMLLMTALRAIMELFSLMARQDQVKHLQLLEVPKDTLIVVLFLGP